MDEAETNLARGYINRIAELRKARGLTQAEMAQHLGISLDRYKKYERRSLLPPYLLPRFAAIVDRPIDYIITGRKPRSRS
jgi:transcriptional regulator with XRE-family HTH domain